VDDILHSEIVNPNRLHSLNARDDASLIRLSKELLPSFSQRQKALAKYLHEAETQTIRVSDKVRALWMDKLDATHLILSVLLDAEKSEAELDEQSKANRLAFFQTARQAWEINLREALMQLSKEMVGPFALGMLDPQYFFLMLVNNWLVTKVISFPSLTCIWQDGLLA